MSNILDNLFTTSIVTLVEITELLEKKIDECLEIKDVSHYEYKMTVKDILNKIDQKDTIETNEYLFVQENEVYFTSYEHFDSEDPGTSVYDNDVYVYYFIHRKLLTNTYDEILNMIIPIPKNDIVTHNIYKYHSIINKLQDMCEDMDEVRHLVKN
jgi:hydroxymethylpyrimidine/phosphomethylpyrimidine kinase